MVGAVALGCKDKSRLRSTGVVLCVWCSVYGALCMVLCVWCSVYGALWCSVYLERRTHANGEVSRVRVGST